jgi:anti-sigma B factor antagonist
MPRHPGDPPVSAPYEPPPQFRCDVYPEREHVRVAPVGELDLASVPELEQTLSELRASGFDHLILDLRGLVFLDSSGLHLLLDLASAARADAHRLELIAGPPAVQRVFELTGTIATLPFR